MLFAMLYISDCQNLELSEVKEKKVIGEGIMEMFVHDIDILIFLFYLSMIFLIFNEIRSRF